MDNYKDMCIELELRNAELAKELLETKNILKVTNARLITEKSTSKMFFQRYKDLKAKYEPTPEVEEADEDEEENEEGGYDVEPFRVRDYVEAQYFGDEY